MLRPEEMARHVSFDEVDPSPGAAPWVERVWSVTWDLPEGVEHVNSIVPHPSVSLTVERGDVDRDGAHGPGVWVTGVSTRRFDAVCRGRGGVVGVKFHPGGFSALTGIPAADLTGRSRLAEGSCRGGRRWPTCRWTRERPGRRSARWSRTWRRDRGPDPGYALVGVVVQALQDPSVTRVDDLADRCGLSVRSLQRLLRQYVGVGPKWMVARRRLHDAVATLDEGYDGSLADLAADRRVVRPEPVRPRLRRPRRHHPERLPRPRHCQLNPVASGGRPGAAGTRHTRAMKLSVVLDGRDLSLLVPFWTTALGYDAVFSLPDFEVLRPREGEPPGPVFILQRVPEERAAGKNRMHVDVHPPLELGVPGLVERLEALGGRRIGEPVTDLLEEIDSWWQVMADPEGNEFCVVADGGHPPPGLTGRTHETQRALMMSSTRSLASPKSIWLFSLKNSGFCTPA